MALISPQHLQSVVTLGKFDPQEKVKTGEPMRESCIWVSVRLPKSW